MKDLLVSLALVGLVGGAIWAGAWIGATLRELRGETGPDDTAETQDDFTLALRRDATRMERMGK